MQKKVNNRPGFVRVLIPGRNKTIQIRQSRAKNAQFMHKHGLVLIQEPVDQTLIPEPIDPMADPKPKVEPMKPAKVNVPKSR